MKSNKNRIVVGAAISAAAIAVAVDHTRHRLPEAEKKYSESQAVIVIAEGEDLPAESGDDCNKASLTGRQVSPCSL